MAMTQPPSPDEQAASRPCIAQFFCSFSAPVLQQQADVMAGRARDAEQILSVWDCKARRR